MPELTRVEKIGGDDSFSMGSTLDLLRSRREEKGIYVFSAFKNSIKGEEFNTTAHLMALWEHISEGLYSAAFEELLVLQEFYVSVIEREFRDDTETESDLRAFCLEQFAFLESMIGRHERVHTDRQADTSSFGLPSKTNDYACIFEWCKISLLGFGEVLTTKLFQRALLGSALLDTSDIPLSADSGKSYDPVKDVYEKISERAHTLLEHSNTVLVPWYVGFLPGGILNTFERGYSDASASNVYNELAKLYPDEHFELAIKKLFTICSADPRIVGVENVRTIRTLSLRLLLEMIGARGAGGPFINRNAVSPRLFQNDWFVRIYSENDPIGSVVTLNGEEKSRWVLFIQSKPVSVVTIISYHMNQEGYIERIGDFFRKYRISIDNIVSSETSITLAVNQKDLEKVDMDAVTSDLRKDLEDLENDDGEGSVKVHHAPISEIYIGGENIDSPGLMMHISTILAEHGINIATNMQPMNPRVIIIGVSRNREQEAVKVLHERLVERSMD